MPLRGNASITSCVLSSTTVPCLRLAIGNAIAGYRATRVLVSNQARLANRRGRDGTSRPPQTSSMAPMASGTERRLQVLRAATEGGETRYPVGLPELFLEPVARLGRPGDLPFEGVAPERQPGLPVRLDGL